MYKSATLPSILIAPNSADSLKQIQFLVEQVPGREDEVNASLDAEDDMRNKPIRAFYLGTFTSQAQDVIRTLKRYKSTVEVQYDGPYKEDRTYSRIYIATTLTESALESYL